MKKGDIKEKAQRWFLRLRGLLERPDVWMWITPLLFVIPNGVLAITERYGVWSRISGVALPLGIYMLLFTMSKKTGRTMLWFSPLILFFIFQLVLLTLYGESIIAIDMYSNLWTTNPGEATELLGNLLVPIILFVLLYLPVVVAGIWLTVKHRYVEKNERIKLRKVAYWVVGVGVTTFILACTLTDSFKPRREIYPYNVVENLITAIRRQVQVGQYYDTSAKFTYKAKSDRPADEEEVYVFILGESSRAANWQLFGYGRPTTPRLSSRNDIVAFPKVLTEINTTHKAVPLMLSSLTPENFGDSVYRVKSLFKAYNDLGYQTAFYSNQHRNHAYIDFYGQEAMRSAFITDGGARTYDTDLLKSLERELENDYAKKKFVVLHAYGSHFEYKKRYPADKAYFKPDDKSRARLENRDHLVNAYDNSVRLTDEFIDEAIGRLDCLNVPAALIYISDHGEDIFDDDRKRLLHSSPTPTYYQLHVPMIVWLSEEYVARHPEIKAALQSNSNKNVAGTSSLFHTLFDITGINSPYYNAEYSLASPLFKEHDRVYLNDYNESVPLSESGIRQQDFEMLKKANIAVD